MTLLSFLDFVIHYKALECVKNNGNGILRFEEWAAINILNTFY